MLATFFTPFGWHTLEVFIKMLESVSLVAIDVDGTLTYKEPYIHLGAIKALRSLGKEVPIALVTGNPYPIAYALTVYLRPCEDVMGIAENGAVVYIGNREILKGDTREMENVRKFLMEKGYYKYLSEDSKFRFVDIALRMEPKDQEKLKKDLSVTGFDVETTSSGYAIHILPRGVSKGTGLLTLCEEMDVDCKEVVAIGDSHNDVSMFSVAGLSITLPNAPKDVKMEADLVVGGPGYGYSLPLALKIVKKIISP